MNNNAVHKHHIIPRHMGGNNSPSNIELVTVAEHAERHRVLFERRGNWQDELAWKALSGQIGKEEATLLAIKKAHVGAKRSLETRKRISEALRGRKLSSPHNKNKSLGQVGWKRPKTKEWCENHSTTMKGRPSGFKGRHLSEESKRKISQQKKLWWERKKCQTNS